MNLSPIENPYDFQYKNKQFETIEKEKSVEQENTKLKMDKNDIYSNSESKK